MSDLNGQLMEDLKTAMKAKDTLALNVLRALKTAVKNAAIEKGGADAVLENAEVMAVVRKQIKQRQDSIESFTQAGRQELADKEASEIEVLKKYLPEPLSEEELVKLAEEAVQEVGATSRKEMGAVMKALQEKVDGRAEGKVMSAAVMKLLG